MRAFADEHCPNLTIEQRNVYNQVVASGTAQNSKLHSIEKRVYDRCTGRNGQNVYGNSHMSMSKLVLCVASTGIAGLQLPGGWTAHSMLKLPLEEKNVSGTTCNISAETQRAEVLRKCDLIVWDEIPTSHRFSVEALNLTLQDLMGNTKLMGGKTVLLSGDLRQIGPVVKFGGPAETIDASIISSPLWKHVQRMRLTNSNETARTLRTLPLFATWALVRNRTRLQMTASTFPH